MIPPTLRGQQPTQEIPNSEGEMLRLFRRYYPETMLKLEAPLNAETRLIQNSPEGIRLMVRAWMAHDLIANGHTLSEEELKQMNRLEGEMTHYAIQQLKIRARESAPITAKAQAKDSANEEILHLDPKYDHVYAVLFYPHSLTWDKRDRDPRFTEARYKAIVNKKTMKAFYFGGIASALLSAQKIQWITQEWAGEEAFEKYFVDSGITLVRMVASESDLTEG